MFDRTQLIFGTNLICKNKRTLPVYIINPTENDMCIEKGMPVALFSEVEKIASPSHDSELFNNLSSA